MVYQECYIVVYPWSNLAKNCPGYTSNNAPPGWLSGERGGLMTWWL